MRRAIAVVFVLVGLATFIWGLAIAFGEPTDFDRAISLVFIVPGLALLASGMFVLRKKNKPGEP